MTPRQVDADHGLIFLKMKPRSAVVLPNVGIAGIAGFVHVGGATTFGTKECVRVRVLGKASE